MNETPNKIRNEMIKLKVQKVTEQLAEQSNKELSVLRKLLQ